MACERCEISAIVDGERRHVKLRFENIEELSWSAERNCVLYQCPACVALWESCAYEPSAREITVAEAARWYPGADVRGSPRRQRPGDPQR